MLIVREIIPGVLNIASNRPEKRNALNGPLIDACLSALKEAEENPAVKIIFLSGEGAHFCAGADMTWMQKMATLSLEENRADAMLLSSLLQMIKTFSKPIVGIVQGAAMGGGLGIIACCDMVLASEKSVYCFSETKIGLTPSVISPFVIPVIGERAASYYFLTADTFSADIAEKLNLVQIIIPEDELKNSAIELAEKLLKNSFFALQEAKKLIRNISEKKSEDLYSLTANHLAMMRNSQDAKEGLQAFLEKRLPNWSQ